MGDGLGDVAKSWLADPPWQKVFKHTFDVIEDYVNYILVAVGGIALSVRLLTTLSTGDLVTYFEQNIFNICIFLTYQNTTNLNLIRQRILERHMFLSFENISHI